MPVYDRWFITPAEGFERTGSDGNTVETVTRPKYSDTSGVAGFSGNTIEPSVVSTHYPALTQTYPDVESWYVVRMYGEDDSGFNALNEIHNKQDTRTLADHASDVAPVLNDHFPALDRSGSTWANSFVVHL